MKKDHKQHDHKKDVKLFQAIQNEDFVAFKNALVDRTDLDIHNLIFSLDHMGFSLIHLCATKGQLDILKFLVTQVKESSLKMLKQREVV